MARRPLVFASLASLWAHARDAEAEREKEAGELFRARTRPPGALETLEGDDPKTEEAAYRRAFGDFGAAFRDLQAPPGEQARLGDDEKDEAAEEDEDAADALDPAAVHAAKVAGLLEGELLDEVVAAHRRVLSALAGPPKPPDSGKLPSSGGGEKAHASVYSEDAFSSVGVRRATIGAPSKYGAALTPEEAIRALRFERAYDVGARVYAAVGAGDAPARIDAATMDGHLTRLALEATAATARPPASVGSGPGDRRVGRVAEAATESGGDAEADAEDAEADAEADALGADLNEGDCAGETSLVVAPVEATRAKILTLLDEWPDHPLLAQLLEICDRVLALPLMGPVKQALTGLELLLARAQTWEEGAASAASLREELARCAELALRWRRRELRTWPRLLARASERHVARANRTWFALHRLLRPPPRSGVGEEAECEKKREEDDPVDARAADERTSERSSKHSKINYAGVDASGLTAEEREGLRQVTLALEEYVQASTIGEFRARLDLLWQFHADADVEARTRRREEGPAGGGDGSGVSGGGARERQLSNVLYNTWRYYAQFAPVVSRKVEAARAPAAQKLRDHARLAKWEDRGYHAMKTSGEANQRSLHKFVRAFDQSLNALALPALEAAAGATGLGDLPSERADAELAGAEAARRANEREQRRLAIEAKVRMRAEAKAAHAAASAGATRGESKAEKAQREADALDARKTLEKELAEASRRVVREAELARCARRRRRRSVGARRCASRGELRGRARRSRKRRRAARKPSPTRDETRR